MIVEIYEVLHDDAQYRESKARKLERKKQSHRWHERPVYKRTAGVHEREQCIRCQQQDAQTQNSNMIEQRHILHGLNVIRARLRQPVEYFEEKKCSEHHNNFVAELFVEHREGQEQSHNIAGHLTVKRLQLPLIEGPEENPHPQLGNEIHSDEAHVADNSNAKFRCHQEDHGRVELLPGSVRIPDRRNERQKREQGIKSGTELHFHRWHPPGQAKTLAHWLAQSVSQSESQARSFAREERS